MKKLALMGLVAGFTILSTIPAFAGQWKQDSTGWWYQNDDGSYPTSTWKWIDGNNDGIAESYYFNESGYIVVNTSVEGYTVNADGAWTINGIVQTKQLSLNDTSTSSSEEKTGSDLFGHRGVGNGTGAEGTLNGGGTESQSNYEDPSKGVYASDDWSKDVDWSKQKGGEIGKGADIHF